MSEETPEPSQAITPYLYYEDVAEALVWLTRAFGFQEREAETMRSPEGRVLHASMDTGAGVILMGCPGADYRSPKSHGHIEGNLYVMVGDVAAHFETARAAGAVLLSELEDAFYGDRRYGVEDCEGHQWYFAEKIRDVPVDEWSPSKDDMSGHG